TENRVGGVSKPVRDSEAWTSGDSIEYVGVESEIHEMDLEVAPSFSVDGHAYLAGPPTHQMEA
ncbi:MAG: hypothetical protein ACE5FA_00680, partial [Dehalococcoidia bacterium]